MRAGFVCALVAVVAGCGATKTVTKTVTRTVASDATAKTDVGPPAEQVLFGYIRSLKRHGRVYRMRFDPAWFLSGTTANVAAAQDGAVSPGEPVPNDNYRLNESHRLLTYLVPADARVTVLTNRGYASEFGATPISVVELAQLVHGERPVKVSEALDTGFWIRVRIDTVQSLDQQYQP